jgi:hypothetical protein
METHQGAEDEVGAQRRIRGFEEEEEEEEEEEDAAEEGEGDAAGGN